MVIRALKHLLMPGWLARRAFGPASVRAIERAIKDSERRHRGEIRFALEGPLHVTHLRHSARQRARQVFALLHVWDTEENTGVLIYVQLVDRAIEIVADRGIAKRVPQAEWEAICRAMERAFKAHRYEQGALEAIGTVTAILARHFPPGAANPNELPDKPVVL
jgi:uncharacterized membrane protein YgcG